MTVVTNRLADIVSRINNGINAKKRYIITPLTKFTLNFLEVLDREGFIRYYKLISTDNNKDVIAIYLKYKGDESVIRSIKTIFKANSYLYIAASDIKIYTHSMHILSTSRGIMSDKQALKENIGGVILCKIE